MTKLQTAQSQASHVAQINEYKRKVKELRDKIKEKCQENMEMSNKCYFMLESAIIKNNELIDLFNKEIQQNENQKEKIERTYSIEPLSKDKKKDIEIRLNDKKKLKKSSIKSFKNNLRRQKIDKIQRKRRRKWREEISY